MVMLRLFKKYVNVLKFGWIKKQTSKSAIPTLKTIFFFMSHVLGVLQEESVFCFSKNAA